MRSADHAQLIKGGQSGVAEGLLPRVTEWEGKTDKCHPAPCEWNGEEETSDVHSWCALFWWWHIHLQSGIVRQILQDFSGVCIHHSARWVHPAVCQHFTKRHPRNASSTSLPLVSVRGCESWDLTWVQVPFSLFTTSIPLNAFDNRIWISRLSMRNSYNCCYNLCYNCDVRHEVLYMKEAKVAGQLISVAVTVHPAHFCGVFVGPPNPPASVSIGTVNINSWKVNISWILGAPNNSPITKVVVEYSTKFAPSVWKVAVEVHDPRQTSAEVTLAPGVQYTFRVFAANLIGNGLPNKIYTSIETPPTGNSAQLYLDLLALLALVAISGGQYPQQLVNNY